MQQEHRPEYEGTRWRDPYSFDARYSAATSPSVNGTRSFKSSQIIERNDVMMEDVAETFFVVTVRDEREGRGSFRSFVQHLDGTGNLHRVELPDSVIKRIVAQTDALKHESRSRKAKAAAEERKANGFVPFQSKS